MDYHFDYYGEKHLISLYKKDKLTKIIIDKDTFFKVFANDINFFLNNLKKNIKIHTFYTDISRKNEIIVKTEENIDFNDILEKTINQCVDKKFDIIYYQPAAV